MKRFIVLALAVGACGQSSSQPGALRAGFTEQQVAQAYNNRVPDRIMQRTCGGETAAPFSCRIYTYEGRWQAGRYHPKLSIVFEQVRGQWLVTQWL